MDNLCASVLQRKRTSINYHKSLKKYEKNRFYEKRYSKIWSQRVLPELRWQDCVNFDHVVKTYEVFSVLFVHLLGTRFTFWIFVQICLYVLFMLNVTKFSNHIECFYDRWWSNNILCKSLSACKTNFTIFDSRALERCYRLIHIKTWNHVLPALYETKFFWI